MARIYGLEKSALSKRQTATCRFSEGKGLFLRVMACNTTPFPSIGSGKHALTVGSSRYDAMLQFAIPYRQRLPVAGRRL